jgi:iron complex outermembrane receptor protein
LKNLFTALFALLLPVLASAQFSISGKVTDHETGEVLPGAIITLDNGVSNTTSNIKGLYNFKSLKGGTYTLKINYNGYLADEKKIDLTANTTIDFALLHSNVMTEEVTVSATRAANNSPTAFTNIDKKDID